MFDAVLKWLSGPLLNFLRVTVTEVWRVTSAWMQNTWLLATAFMSVVWWLFDVCKSIIVQLVASIDGIILPGSAAGMPGTLTYAASVCNTFMPLSEACGLLVAYMALILVLTGYRLIKSWIPTLS